MILWVSNMMGSKLDCPSEADCGTEGSHPDRLPSCDCIQCVAVLEAVCTQSPGTSWQNLGKLEPWRVTGQLVKEADPPSELSLVPVLGTHVPFPFGNRNLSFKHTEISKHVLQEEWTLCIACLLQIIYLTCLLVIVVDYLLMT